MWASRRWAQPPREELPQRARLFVFVAIFGSLLAPYDPYASSTDVLAPPSSDHWLGTTEVGSDVFSQLLVGARVSMVVGIVLASRRCSAPRSG